MKIFSVLLSNNISIFWELLSNSTDFFTVYITQYTFSDRVTTNTTDYFQIHFTKQSFRFKFILINWDNCIKCLSSKSFEHRLGLTRYKMNMVKIFAMAQASKIGFVGIYYQTKPTFSEISKQKAGNKLTYHILYFAIPF